ncbi:hypothetical protein B0A49_03091 [Cryomyces minteri]|uniref:Uncharacterized protein n=1 Tax=Cryomyces minteri TaxID=331657 RepID=A0A4U0WT11_9PEZI|nr:hypothetical protein B0A49_10186 [Cryomyces minteri]TKA76599.1 hypothetical protein B0A49_03326 [Cryomyces minteri]TKA80352.1 hypothetical protein B0A49_03091 [Cryomyces minteri]
MSSEQTFSTHDLRSNAQDYKRDADHKHKWALGESEGKGRASGKTRPARIIQRQMAAMRRETHSHTASLDHRDKLARKHDVLGEQYHSCASGDSSADEDVTEASAAPVPDADITYSFDAPRGPSHGSQILSLALAKAVERFENVETDRLVKTEYEVLDSEGEAIGGGPAKKSKAVKEDDGFVFV